MVTWAWMELALSCPGSKIPLVGRTQGSNSQHIPQGYFSNIKQTAELFFYCNSFSGFQMTQTEFNVCNEV